jgi:hypothetical protein
VVRIATPPEKTRNRADANKVAPNVVPPDETVSRLLCLLSAKAVANADMAFLSKMTRT